MSGGVLYFAYGSNLDRAQMRRRCPSARLVGAGSVAGFRFEFAGWSRGRGGAVANIRAASRRARVNGLVWHVTLDDIARLDRFEGVPFQYERETMGVRMERSGKVLSTEVYVLAEPVERGALPSDSYLAIIGRAYRAHGFSSQPLFNAIRELTTRRRIGTAVAPPYEHMARQGEVTIHPREAGWSREVYEPRKSLCPPRDARAAKSPRR